MAISFIDNVLYMFLSRFITNGVDNMLNYLRLFFFQEHRTIVLFRLIIYDSHKIDIDF
jgi:hypothetical protein